MPNPTTLRLRRKAKLEKQLARVQAEGVLKRTIEAINNPKELNEKQWMAVHMYADLENNWPREFIADQVGVTLNTLAKWKNDPRFLEALNTELSKRHTAYRREALGKLFKMIKRGDWRAVKEYLKATGDLKENIHIEAKRVNSSDSDSIDQEITGLMGELGFNDEDSEPRSKAN